MILIVEGHALPLIQSFCYSHQIDITLNLEVFFFFNLKFELLAN